jgi:hypothetical protein
MELLMIIRWKFYFLGISINILPVIRSHPRALHDLKPSFIMFLGFLWRKEFGWLLFVVSF